MDDSWWIVGDTNGVVVVGFMGSVFLLAQSGSLRDVS